MGLPEFWRYQPSLQYSGIKYHLACFAKSAKKIHKYKIQQQYWWLHRPWSERFHMGNIFFLLNYIHQQPTPKLSIALQVTGIFFFFFFLIWGWTVPLSLEKQILDQSQLTDIECTKWVIFTTPGSTPFFCLFTFLSVFGITSSSKEASEAKPCNQ